MNFLKYHLPLILYAVAIFVLSSISQPPQVLPHFTFKDKIFHISEYAVFGILLWHSLSRWQISLRAKRLLILAILLGALYAASDEYHQSLVPGRTSDVYDWVADIIGLAVGVTALVYYKRKKSGD